MALVDQIKGFGLALSPKGADRITSSIGVNTYHGLANILS